jgi:hypothetical protein
MSYDYKKPEVKFNKNGYEIRTEILSMAQGLICEEFHAKRNSWEVTATRDEKGVITTKVGMPEFPGIDQVLKTAEAMYEFVNKGADRKNVY